MADNYYYIESLSQDEIVKEIKKLETALDIESRDLEDESKAPYLSQYLDYLLDQQYYTLK